MGKKLKKILPIDQRIVMCLAFFLFVFLYLVYHIFSLQIVQHQAFLSKANAQYDSALTSEILRGEIKVKSRASGDYVLVATNLHRDVLVVDPTLVKDKDLAAQDLSKVVGGDEKEIRAKLATKNSRYVVLKDQLTPEQLDAVKKLRIPGVALTQHVDRFYPEGEFLSQTLGFLGYKNGERAGNYGLESSFESALKGEKHDQPDTDSGADSDELVFLPEVKRGDSLILTVDYNLQRQTEKFIQEAVEHNEAESGSVVVLDPKTGAVLAMATFPDFDLNAYAKVGDGKVYLNQVTQIPYEPGSIVKPLTLSAAINEKQLSSTDTYYDPGKLIVDGFTIKNSDGKSHGTVNMSYVLEQSLNTGAIYAKNKIGDKKFVEYLRKFGLGQLTGVEVDESKGSLSSVTSSYVAKVNYDTASFGQGINVTLLQMARVFSAFANEGKLITPYLVEDIQSDTGNVTPVNHHPQTEIISKDAAKEVTKMLISVVDKGHGKQASVPGYTVAGKTGTAQVPKKNGKGYEEDNNIGSFVGFAPASDPKVLIAVRVNHPKNVKFAESTAAPVFSKIAKYFFDYYGVAKDRP